MSSPHLPGPHGFIIATKLSLFLLLFCCVAPFFRTLERNPSISIQSPVQLLNNSFPFFNNLFVNETNSFPSEPNSYPVVLYREPNSYPVVAYLEPNSYPVIPYFEPNSYPVVLYFEPNSFQGEPNSLQNNSIQVQCETPLKNTSELSILYLLLRLQDTYVDSENNTIETPTIQNNIERNIILSQINSYFIFSI